MCTCIYNYLLIFISIWYQYTTILLFFYYDIWVSSYMTIHLSIYISIHPSTYQPIPSNHHLLPPSHHHPISYFYVIPSYSIYYYITLYKSLYMGESKKDYLSIYRYLHNVLFGFIPIISIFTMHHLSPSSSSIFRLRGAGRWHQEGGARTSCAKGAMVQTEERVV